MITSPSPLCMLALGKSGDRAYELTITDLYMGSVHFCVIDSSVYLEYNGTSGVMTILFTQVDRIVF